MSKLRIKDVFRYGRPYDSSLAEIDGYRNHFFVTNYPDGTMALLERGINALGIVTATDGKRVPAILIRSSPHKIGSETTPWQDVFDVDNGHIRFYGDNKEPGSDPANAPGNKVLLSAFNIYNDPDHRERSVPLIFYKSVTRQNKSKGYIEFNGFGIITAVEFVTQYDRKLDRTFFKLCIQFPCF